MVDGCEEYFLTYYYYNAMGCALDDGGAWADTISLCVVLLLKPR